MVSFISPEFVILKDGNFLIIISVA